MDQNGSVHEFEYDLLGRQIVDKATTLGADVDDVVRRVEREYGVHGMLERTANYDATTAGSVVNDVEFTYNGFGQLTVDSQEHDGEIDGNTLDVQYAHVAGASNLYRRALTTYPNGRVLYYYYGGICGYISRPYYVRDYPTANDTCHGVYYYQGLDEIIRHTVNLSGVVTLDRAYDNGSGGYSDRFGRLTDLYWYGWVPQACVAQVKHDYDRVSNRLCREDVLAKSQGTPIYIDELYTYDGMHQLTAQQRGELNVAHDGLVANSKTFAEQWTLDPTGNWSEFKQDTDGDGDWDLDQDRDHTTANEVLEIDDATTHVAHDRAGNMTRIPKPSDWSSHYHLVYDAWNRLVCVYDSDGETPISAYYYDGLGRRVIKDVYDEGSLASRRHYYYSDTWQVLEERLETSDGSGGFDTAIVDRQYVWGLRYVDDLLSRDRNTDGTSTGDYGKTGSGLDERLMVLQDANYNVCAIASTTGTCLERYNYTAYGEPNCLTPTFADRASTDYDWDILYTGRQYDSETGLYQYRNRYYHPQLGRFINRDPMLLGVNLYCYCCNAPLLQTDPSGLKPLNNEKREELLKCAEKELVKNGVSCEEMELRLNILRSVLYGNITFNRPPVRDKTYWEIDEKNRWRVKPGKSSCEAIKAMVKGSVIGSCRQISLYYILDGVCEYCKSHNKEVDFDKLLQQYPNPTDIIPYPVNPGDTPVGGYKFYLPKNDEGKVQPGILQPGDQIWVRSPTGAHSSDATDHGYNRFYVCNGQYVHYNGQVTSVRTFL